MRALPATLLAALAIATTGCGDEEPSLKPASAEELGLSHEVARAPLCADVEGRAEDAVCREIPTCLEVEAELADPPEDGRCLERARPPSDD